jgi:O-antigen/teichoic acid export membrane protein
VGGGALAAVAETIPWILGPSFQASVQAVTLLAALPAVQVFRWLLSTAMTGLDLHRHFYIVHGVGAVTNILLVALLSVPFGLSGAVFAAYGTEALLIVIQGWILVRHQRVCRWSARPEENLT